MRTVKCTCVTYVTASAIFMHFQKKKSKKKKISPFAFPFSGIDLLQMSTVDITAEGDIVNKNTTCHAYKQITCHLKEKDRDEKRE